jgi:hypothetical protein
VANVIDQMASVQLLRPSETLVSLKGVRVDMYADAITYGCFVDTILLVLIFAVVYFCVCV